MYVRLECVGQNGVDLPTVIEKKVKVFLVLS
jgi:hypothetical protein